MRRLVVIGHSAAAVRAVEQIRADDQEAEIVFCLFDDELPYDQARLFEFVGRQCSRPSLFFQKEDFYQNHRVQLLTGCSFQRFNFSRNYFFLDERGKIEYDALVFADWPKRDLGEIKGSGREGVFTLGSLAEADDLVGLMPELETAAVVVDGLDGLMWAFVLADRQKEVIALIRGQRFLPDLDEAVATRLCEILTARGIRVLFDSSVAEILGDAEVRAVRLSGGKVLACEAVLFPDARMDLRLLAKESLGVAGGVLVDEALRAGVTNVMAVGRVAECHSDAVGWLERGAEGSKRAADLMAAFWKGETGSPGISVLKKEIFAGGGTHLSALIRRNAGHGHHWGRRFIAETGIEAAVFDADRCPERVVLLQSDREDFFLRLMRGREAMSEDEASCFALGVCADLSQA